MPPDAPTEMPAEVTKRPPRRSRVVWVLVLAVVVLAAAGVGSWLLLSGGTDEVVISFDGSTATYTGPEQLVAGEETTLVLENNSSNRVAFAAALVKQDWTLDEAKEHEYRTFRSNTPSPWMASYRVIANADPGETLNEAYTFPEYAFELYVWDWDITLGHHAAWVEATAE